MSFEAQKQVKDNAEELRNFLTDLESWSGKMNSETLKNKDCASISKPVPPVRNCSKKRESYVEPGEPSGSKVTKRISSFDYNRWDNFDVEKACEEIDQEPENSSTDSLKLQDEALYEKERGNRFVKNEKWDDAIVCYSKAIKLYPKDATFYANRALCYLKKKQYRSVEADSTSALQLDPDYVKALQRRASARKELNQLDDAVKDLKKALELEPNNKALKADLAVLQQKLDSKGPLKSTQMKGPLKWTPPSKKESSPDASTSSASPASTTLTESSSEASSTPTEQVLISPAKKHTRGGEVSVGSADDTKTRIMKSQLPKTSKPTDIPSQPSRPVVWFAKEGAEVVLPISKPPHRRSKVPLKRLSIRECPNYNLNAELVCANENTSPEEAREVTNSEGKKTVGGIKEVKSLTIKKSHNQVYTDESNLPTPSTSVQFIAVWKVIKNDPQLCYKFLKKIDAENFPKIFQDCLESDIFSSIIRTVESDFTKNGDPVYDYLVGLSRVPRFNMLTMFLSTADKTSLQKLFEYCQIKEGHPVESVEELRKRYEM